MVDALAEVGIDGASVLEVGAGAGTALVSLFWRGAAKATAVDLSPHYEETARSLLAGQGIDRPVEWHTGDFVDLAATLPTSDEVFLNRVVCCYPSMDRLVDSAVEHSDRLLTMSYPRDTMVTRLFFRIANWWLRVRRSAFRVFLHDPDAVDDRVQRAGFAEVTRGTTSAWEWRVWARA